MSGKIQKILLLIFLTLLAFALWYYYSNSHQGAPLATIPSANDNPTPSSQENIRVPSNTPPVSSFGMDFSTAEYHLTLQRKGLPFFLLKLLVHNPSGHTSLQNPSEISPVIVSSAIYTDFRAIFESVNRDYPRSNDLPVIYTTRGSSDRAENDCEYELKSENILFVVFNNPGTGWPKFAFSVWDFNGEEIKLKAILNRTFDPGYYGIVNIFDVKRFDENNYLLFLNASGGEGGYHSMIFALWRKPRQLILLREVEMTWGGIMESSVCDKNKESQEKCKKSAELTYKFSPKDFTVELMRHRRYAKTFNLGKTIALDFKQIIAGIPPNSHVYAAESMAITELDLPNETIAMDAVAETLLGDDYEKQQTILDEMRDEGNVVKPEYLTPEIGEALYQLLSRNAKPTDHLNLENNSREVPLTIKILWRIGDFEDKRALPYLLANVGNPSADYENIEFSLAKMGAPAIAPMFQKLQSKNIEDRKAAVRFFKVLLHPKELDSGEITTDYRNIYDPDDALKEKIRTALRQSINDEDGGVRIYSLDALRLINNPADTELLKEAQERAYTK